jgi:predicted HicB family RNase H-like nuclease
LLSFGKTSKYKYDLAVNDLVMFEGNSTSELKQAFEEAVDDYPELCRDAGT